MQDISTQFTLAYKFTKPDILLILAYSVGENEKTSSNLIEMDSIHNVTSPARHIFRGQNN